ncbi:HAAS signaling domain-containing protein [Paenibacillus sp. NPDC057967]|uniref:HAAS signaling domain-containing protein n=1 Tax=Paenibacillus sp. NPDC057967 TaxID=3346293 RepID=UPI0036DD8438
MELIVRYVHAVISKLPVEQRDDIEKELRGLIEDMLEERTGHDNESADTAEIEAVLLELGPPAELAAKYSGRNRYLIGPGLFDSYVRVLKVVGMAIVIAMSVVLVIDMLQPVGSNPVTAFSGIFARWIGSIIEAVMQGFVWVTVIFAVLEYKGVKDSGKKKAWQPSDLPPIPSSELQIKRSEPIVSIIFTVLFTAIFISLPEWIGVHISHSGEYYHVPLFNVEILKSYAPLIWGSAALLVLKEILKLVAGKWSKGLIVYHIIISVLVFIAALILFADSTIWNGQFVLQLQEIARQLADGKDFGSVLSVWNNVTANVIYFIVLFFLIDLALLLYKAYKLRTYL